MPRALGASVMRTELGRCDILTPKMQRSPRLRGMGLGRQCILPGGVEGRRGLLECRLCLCCYLWMLNSRSGSAKATMACKPRSVPVEQCSLCLHCKRVPAPWACVFAKYVSQFAHLCSNIVHLLFLGGFQVKAVPTHSDAMPPQSLL